MRPFDTIEVEVFSTAFVQYAICVDEPIPWVFCGP
jgi:hypothetical protein